ncbi:hypothetical protein T261_01554 [Streptomyces lydicus]|nr:hypothetical protein T261_01554 [Streptomyces lydicus]
MGYQLPGQERPHGRQRCGPSREARGAGEPGERLRDGGRVGDGGAAAGDGAGQQPPLNGGTRSTTGEQTGACTGDQQSDGRRHASLLLFCNNGTRTHRIRACRGGREERGVPRGNCLTGGAPSRP